MSERYYLDTCIWVDIYEDRKGFQGEPMGEYGLRLLTFIISENHILVVSDILTKELEMIYSAKEVERIMNHFQGNVIKVFSTERQRMEAIKISKERWVPKGDVLHAIIARDNNLILVTRDNHFKRLKDISRHHKPEEII